MKAGGSLPVGACRLFNHPRTDLDRGSTGDRRHMQNLTLEEGVPIGMERPAPCIAWVSHNLIRNSISIDAASISTEP